MRQRTPRNQHDWLTEEEGHGFEELAPVGPVISITIMPKGNCYRLAKDIIARLARVHPEAADQEPHITLQGVYNQADLELLKECVGRVAAQTSPFCVNVTGVGLLSSPSNPEMLFLHLHVEKSPELVALYAALKRELQALGLQTYRYSPEEWIPHLTLAYGRWSRADLHGLLRELGPRLPVCILPADELRLNRLRETGDWQLVARFPFGEVRC